MSAVLAIDWADTSTIGYPVIFGGVLLGSIIPIVPTGAVVGAGAAVAMTTPHLNIFFVIIVATIGAMVGDLVTYAVARISSGPALRWFTRGHKPEQLEQAREKFRKSGWQIIVIGRLVPAGRIPVLLAAGTLRYSWQRLVPAVLAACALWAVAYALLGVVSGGIFDSPLVATLIATGLVLVVSVVMALINRRRHPAEGTPEKVDT